MAKYTTIIMVIVFGVTVLFNQGKEKKIVTFLFTFIYSVYIILKDSSFIYEVNINIISFLSFECVKIKKTTQNKIYTQIESYATFCFVKVLFFFLNERKCCWNNAIKGWNMNLFYVFTSMNV